MKEQPTGHPGFTAVPTWLLGQASPIELAILLAIQEAPNQQISLAALAIKAGVGKSTACRVLLDLQARDWLAKEPTIEDDGATGPNRYILKIWDPQAAEEPASPSRLEHNHQNRLGNGSAPFALLAACSAKKGALFVYLALQAFEAPTINTLAKVCSMDPGDVRGALKFLEGAG
jgi:DNA-binding MarR family transcriptional regulator